MTERRTARAGQITVAATAVALLLSAPLALAGPAAKADPQPSATDQERDVVVIRSRHRLPPLPSGARGYLGVALLDLTPELRRHFGVAEDHGVMIARVEPDSPAGAAGVEAGDILTTIDGEPVGSHWQVVRAIGRRQGGETVDLEIWRDGAWQTITATLAERERPQVDVGRFLLRCADDEEDCDELLLGDGFAGAVELDREVLDRALKRLQEHLDSPRFRESILEFGERNRQLEERISELEARLRELEKSLESLER